MTGTAVVAPLLAGLSQRVCDGHVWVDNCDLQRMELNQSDVSTRPLRKSRKERGPPVVNVSERRFHLLRTKVKWSRCVNLIEDRVG